MTTLFFFFEFAKHETPLNRGACFGCWGCVRMTCHDLTQWERLEINSRGPWRLSRGEKEQQTNICNPYGWNFFWDDASGIDVICLKEFLGFASTTSRSLYHLPFTDYLLYFSKRKQNKNSNVFFLSDIQNTICLIKLVGPFSSCLHH
jgi:hypothetical protein